MRHLVAGAVLLVAFSGCASAPRLPTAPNPPPNVDVVCPDALLTGTLAGDPRDPRLAWVVAPTGARVEVTWPSGFSAVFDPGLRILAADGTVVAKAGQVSLGGGFGLADGGFRACAVNGRLFLPGSASADP